MHRKNLKKVLLIDDDPAIYHTIQMVLEGSGNNLIYCDNIKAALRCIKNRSGMDLIILDIMMPDRSGFEFLDIYKEMKIMTPVIVLSAIDSAKAATEALKKGAADYVTKPFTLEDIRKVINKHINAEFAVR